MQEWRKDLRGAGSDEQVRCLECDVVYTKPAAGGVVRQNPGCPSCGYVGWLSTAIPFTPEAAPRRSVVGRPPPPSASPG